MWRYLGLHEEFVTRALAGDYGPLSLVELLAFHERQTARMQHERLIHLVVTMFVALFLLLAVGYASLRPTLPAMALAALLLVLAAAYLVHYYRLENGVQRWYHIANRIEATLGQVSACYDRGRVEVVPGFRRLGG